MTAIEQKILIWIRDFRPSQSEAVSRWGHFFQHLEDTGRVRTVDHTLVIRSGIGMHTTDTVIVV